MTTRTPGAPRLHWEYPERYATPGEWFQAEFPWTRRFTWLDIDGFTPLDDGRLVRMSLNYGNSVDHWDRVVVTILNKLDGPVDQKAFKFEDYMQPVKRPAPDGGSDLYCYGKKGWYIAIPVTTNQFVHAVETYIGLFE